MFFWSLRSFLFLRATLTLPGIAGLVLSVGMAVDANILVHERIKEELRWGKTTRAPLTRLSPGFYDDYRFEFDNRDCSAVPLSIWNWPGQRFCRHSILGITANIFTAVFVTRWMFDYLTLKLNVKKLSI